MLNAWQTARIGLSIACLTGCQPGQLYVASDTVLGLHANVNTARNSGSFQFGYDRHFATVVPRSVVVGTAPEGGLAATGSAREVMAVLGCSDVEVNGLFLSKFVENLATGRAALNYANALKADKVYADQFFNCFRDP